MILSRWPSYVYVSPLSLENPSKNIIIVEPINGINGKPILITSLNLDSGLVN